MKENAYKGVAGLTADKSLMDFGRQLFAGIGLTQREAVIAAGIRSGLGPRQDSGRIKISMADDGKMGEILIYEDIGLDWWSGEGMTAKRFDEELKALGDIEILNVRINSPGGDVFDALAIYAMLSNHSARVEVDIDGLAASAASFLAMAGNEIRMLQSSMMMIHDAWGVVVGNAADMADMAAVLDKIDGQIAGMYAAHSGGDPVSFRTAMDAETWYTAEEAVDAGLADVLLKPPAKDDSDGSAGSEGDSAQALESQRVAARARAIQLDSDAALINN